MGNFNAKSSIWWGGQSTNEASDKLALMAISHGLVQIVNGPTRASGSSCAAQLDLMFIDNVSLVSKCEILSPVADHNPTIAQLSLSHRRKQQRHYLKRLLQRRHDCPE